MPVHQVIEMLDFFLGIFGEKRTEVDAAFALAGAATVSAFPWLLEAIGDCDIVMLLVADAVEEVASVLEGTPAGDADLLVQLRVAGQISLGLDVGQIGSAVRVAALIVAGRQVVHASIRAVQISVPGGVASCIFVGHQLSRGAHGGSCLAFLSSLVKDSIIGSRSTRILLSHFDIRGVDRLLEEGVVAEAPVDVLEHGIVGDLLRVDLITQLNEVGMVPILAILITAVDASGLLGGSLLVLSVLFAD